MAVLLRSVINTRQSAVERALPDNADHYQRDGGKRDRIRCNLSTHESFDLSALCGFEDVLPQDWKFIRLDEFDCKLSLGDKLETKDVFFLTFYLVFYDLVIRT